jgi:hypothetical protein
MTDQARSIRLSPLLPPVLVQASKTSVASCTAFLILAGVIPVEES